MILLAQLIDDVVTNKFEINTTSTTIGRHPDSNIQIDDAAISGRHAVITLKKSKYLDDATELFLEDLGSKNGSFINDRQITGKQQLNNGDVVRFGWNKFKLINADTESLEATALILQ